MYLMGMRCSFGNVPLEFMEACISPNTFINNIPINGVFALKNAIEEKNKGNIDISEKSFLEKYGYKNINEITEDYFKYILQKPFPEKITNTNNIDSLLMCKTKNNEYLQDNPPNIVFVLTESMSSYFFKIHSENFNLLGSLENELKKCILFKNFVSCRNFTIYTIDGLLINSPLSPISQSKYLNTRFYSALQPFLDKGYDVEFVTGGRLNWRNLDQFFPRQGFNKLEGGSDIKKYVPDAIEEHEWGVYDEFLMKRIIQKLHEKRKKPLFIFAITITNHTPYKTPKNYSPYPIKFNEQNKKLFKSFDKKTINILTSHQYTCNCIGNLINEVSNSALSENTIIVATGDHSSHEIRNHFGFTDKNLMDKNGVPLIFYIPNNYKKDIFVDTSRFGSHKDIFPTLYNLALSNAEYYCVGNDLFSKNNKQDFFGIFEYNIAINKSGCVILDNSNPIFMEWKANSYNDLDYVNSPSSSLIDLYKKLKSYSAFNTIRIIEQIKSKNNLTK